MSNVTAGSIVKISGPIIDVKFTPGLQPPISALLKVEGEDKYAEVAAHEKDGVVRAIALDPTEGLYCGMNVTANGEGIRVPVGKEMAGRAVDVLGRPIDGKGDPIFNSAVPCVFTRTPPGPKIFSAGPKSKCISEKSNLSFPFDFAFSASFTRKNC